MKLFLIITLIFITTCTFAQSTDTLKTLNESDTIKTAAVKSTKASFPGGKNEFTRFLVQHLDMQVAPPDGRNYKVTIRFKVGVDGKVSDVEAVKTENVCRRCELEAERVMRRMPNWKPATENGERVVFSATQSITMRNEVVTIR